MQKVFSAVLKIPAHVNDHLLKAFLSHQFHGGSVKIQRSVDMT